MSVGRARRSALREPLIAPQPRTRARRGEGDTLRVEFLRAAGKLLDEGGERALTIRAVAAVVGVTRPSVYQHYRDKAELMDAVCFQAWRGLEKQMLDAASGSSDPAQALRLRAVAYARFALSNAVRYRLLMAPRSGGRSEIARQASDALLEHLVAAVRPCVEAGVFRGDTLQLTLGIWAAIHGCVTLLMSHPELPWSGDIDSFADHVGRMSGLGTALLSRVQTLGSPPTSEVYARVLDATLAELAET